MKSQINKIKTAGISLLLLSTTVFAADIKPVIAGCGSGPVQAWTIDAVTGKKTSLGQGTLTACGNKSGAHEAVRLPGLTFGWAHCSSNCKPGATPNETTVQINLIHKPGSFSIFPKRMVCVSQNVKPLFYCWK